MGNGKLALRQQDKHGVTYLAWNTARNRVFRVGDRADDLSGFEDRQSANRQAKYVQSLTGVKTTVEEIH